jgi:hypothetical protein
VPGVLCDVSQRAIHTGGGRMIKGHIKDKNVTSLRLAQRLQSIRADAFLCYNAKLDVFLKEIDWIEDELLMRELQFRSDHPECRRNKNDPEWSSD